MIDLGTEKTPRRAMSRVIAFSGYMATGKSTAIRDLCNRLQGQGIAYGIVNPRRLFLAFTLRQLFKKKKRKGSRSADRESPTWTPHKMPWDRAWSFAHLVNTLVAILRFRIVCALNRGKMIICNRYFYDTYISHQQERQRLAWRFVRWVTPVPSLTFLLLPPAEVIEERLLQRIDRERLGQECLVRMLRADIDEGIRRYQEIIDPRSGGNVVVLDTSRATALEEMWEHVCKLVCQLHESPCEAEK